MSAAASAKYLRELMPDVDIAIFEMADEVQTSSSFPKSVSVNKIDLFEKAFPSTNFSTRFDHLVIVVIFVKQKLLLARILWDETHSTVHPLALGQASTAEIMPGVGKDTDP